MRISQLADATGVPATTLRFYESAGLLPAERTASGYRLYDQDAIERLSFIGAAKHLGLPLEEIAELLAIWEAGACVDVKTSLRPRIAARLDDAERRLAELCTFTASLQQSLEHLDQLPDRSTRCDPECGFLTPASTVAKPRPVPVEISSRPPEADDERWRTAPVACSLTSKDLGDRIGQWHQLLDGADTVQIPDGVRVTLPAERAGDVAALAAAEQGCCPFFDFRLHLTGATLNLEVRAPAEGAELLADLFQPAA